MYPLDQLEKNLTTIDRQLLFLLLQEARETNRLLSVLTNENNGVEESHSDEHTTAEKPTKEVKRGRKPKGDL